MLFELLFKPRGQVSGMLREQPKALVAEPALKFAPQLARHAL